MVDGYDDTIGAAVLGGGFAIVGVVLGVLLTYKTTKKINEQQSKEARRVRKIQQLEKLSASLEGLQTQLGALVGQITGVVALNQKPEFKSIPDAKLSEIQFLVGVYLPEAIPTFRQLKLEFGGGISKAFEALADKGHGNNSSALELLASALKWQASFTENLQKIQDQIAYRAREIESE